MDKVCFFILMIVLCSLILSGCSHNKESQDGLQFSKYPVGAKIVFSH